MKHDGRLYFFFICDIIQAFLLKCVKQCESYGLRNEITLHSHMYSHGLEMATKKMRKSGVQNKIWKSNNKAIFAIMQYEKCT